MELLEDYVPAKQAARAIGISYELLHYRIRKKKIRGKKHGYSVFVHKDEVERERKAELERRKLNRKKGKQNASRKTVGRATG